MKFYHAVLANLIASLFTAFLLWYFFERGERNHAAR